MFTDLSRTLEVLQQRVQALERNLSPYTVPYPTVSTYPYQINAGPSPVANGKKLLSVSFFNNEVFERGRRHSFCVCIKIISLRERLSVENPVTSVL